jgi:phosphoserine phosphatase
MSEVTVKEIIAIVFDFDDTLMPDSTSKLLRSHGVKPEDFWPKSDELIRQGYDQPTAYLKLLLDNVGEGKPLGSLTNDDLRRFGAGLDGDFFSGLPGFFDDVRSQVLQRFKNIDVEFYIISGGLQAIMEGSNVVNKYFAGAYGCQLGTGPGSNVVSHIKRSITFTEKTRYLFEINKGIRQRNSEANPFLVNKDVKHEDRRIPLKNIVYVGDGLTDIPCFSTVKHFGGEAFGVFDPSSPEKTKRALLEFLVPKRVVGMYKPRYEATDELGALLRMWVFNRAAAIQIERDISNRATSGSPG